MARRRAVEEVLPIEPPEHDYGYDEDEHEPAPVRSPIMRPTVVTDATGAHRAIVEVPIWEDALANGASAQIRVQRQEDDGRVVDLGMLPADATDRTILAKWPRPGKYLLMPVDVHGRGLKQAPYVRFFSSDHEALRTAREDGLAAAGPSPADIAMQMLREELRVARQEMAAERAALRAREEAIAQREIDVRRDHSAAATMLTDRSQELTQRHLEQAASLQHTQVTGIMSLMQAQQAAAEAAAQRALAEQERRMRDADAEHKRTMERMREEARARQEEERQRLEDERLRREQIARDEREQALARQREWLEEMQRREEARRNDDDRRWEREQAAAREERARQREHEAKLRELADSKDPIKTMQSTIVGLGAVTKALGVSLPDVISGVMGGAKSKSIAETIAETVGSVVKTVVEAQSGGGDDEDGGDDEQVTVQTPQGPVTMPRAQYEQAMAQQQVQAAARAPAQIAGPTAAPGEVDARTLAAFRTASAAPAQPAQPQMNMPAAQQRASRQAVRRFVEAVKQAPEDQWPMLLAQAVAETPEVIDFLRLTTIRSALREAECPEPLIARIIAQIDAAGIAPDVPRG